MAGQTVVTTSDNPHIVAQNETVRLEVSAIGMHRLVSKTNPERATEWASYRSYTFMDGWVGVTPYYTGRDQSVIITPEQFMLESATKEQRREG